MKQELSPAVVWSVIVAVVVIVAIVIFFGAFKPQIGKGPEIKPRPFSPAGYAGAPADLKSKQGEVAPAPYHGPGGPMGAPSAPPAGTTSK